MKKTTLAALVAIHSVVLAHGQTTDSNATPIITVTKNAQSDFQVGSAFSRIDAEEMLAEMDGIVFDDAWGDDEGDQRPTDAASPEVEPGPSV